MHTAWIQHVHLISVPHNIESAMYCDSEEVGHVREAAMLGLHPRQRRSHVLLALFRCNDRISHFVKGGGGGGGGGAFNQKCTELNFRFSWISFSFRLIDKL